jgi:hypothetical protein
VSKRRRLTCSQSAEPLVMTEGLRAPFSGMAWLNLRAMI